MSQPWTTSASATLGGRGDTVTLVEGPAFAISLPSGDMLPGFPHGLFFRDTRFLSEFRLRVNGQWPEPLSATPIDPFSAAFVLRAPPAAGVADSHLVIFRNRYVGRGMREDVVVRNYGSEPTFCALEFLVDADFADLFEVKEGRVEKIGDREVERAGRRLAWTYRRGPFTRGAHLDFSVDVQLLADHADVELIVPAGGKWEACLQLTPVIDGTEVAPRYQCGRPVERSTPAARLDAWRRNLPTITTEHDSFAALLERSADDLAALRLFDPQHPDRAVVAAGAPWFMTVFGRDSLITSWMAMMIDSRLALGTLQTLASLQGVDVNPLTEEEPGRILHEMRFGESSQLSLGGGRVYYGSVDATPLFVMLLGELRRWGTNRAEVDALLPAADRALGWISDFGDRDDDGYVEYLRTSDRGLRNQGWKDSHDAVRFVDGRLAEPPIALCEVQAYVYAAYIARALFASEQGDDEFATEMYARAADLKRRFNEDFWIDERGWLAMGLDRDKSPIDALTSNMGHCLWTGILDEDKAQVVGARLVDSDLFSGWGIRTLGASMVGYNPVSYHNGSVWPHDNALCAAGLMRYGLTEAAHRVMEGVVAAAAYFGNRLPELFAGLSRTELPFPVGYPTSCSPQAWAAASPLLFLRSMLHFDPDVRNGKLHLAPDVPQWIGRLVLGRVPLAGGHVSIEVEGDVCKVLELPSGLTLVPEPRPPTL
ncbi:MAG TPA: glycogen debranching N-terminal domain-containing protein [Acidimicrobiia bacterium]|nr:glycogen debranching N-terminal domain-containing protein [Acidimicrobiia bacterium]